MIYNDLRFGDVKSRTHTHTHTHTHSKNYASNAGVAGNQAGLKRIWLGFAGVALMFFLSIPLNAATHTVTVATDDATTAPDGSLRKILSEATANDEIVFANGVTSITLAGAITIDKNITLNGAGVTITGSGSDCLFKITGGEVKFLNLTLTGGKPTSGGSDLGGGAVEVAAANANATFAAEGCTFTDNADARGAAVLVLSTGTGSSAFTATNCTFSNNTATAGGGAVYVRGTTGAGTFTATNCVFTGNSAPSGGAVYAHVAGGTGTFTATNCFFEGNTASTGTGGAINVDGATVNLYHCTVVNNTATTNGGGINVATGTVTSKNSIWIANTANGSASQTAGTVTSTNDLTQNGTNTKELIFGSTPTTATNGCWIPLQSASKQLTAEALTDVDGVASDIAGRSRARAAVVDGKVCAGAYDIDRICTVTVENADPATGGTVSETYTDKTFPYGSKISLTATPEACHTFTKWSIVVDEGSPNESNTTANLANYELAGNTVKITPTFTDNSSTQITITLTQADKGGVATSKPETLSNLTCGTTVTFTATSTGGYRFVRWEDGSGNVLSGANPFALTIDAALTVKPVFSSAPMQIGNITIESGGEVILRPGGTPATSPNP